MNSRISGNQSVRKCLRLFSCIAEGRLQIFATLALAIGLMLINVFGEVRMNAWQGLFFSAIELRNPSEIFSRCSQFVILVAVLLCFVVAYYFLIDYLKIFVRTSIATNFTNRWLTPNCSYRMALQEDGSLCPDQRIQEDVRQFTELSIDLGLDLLKSVILIFSFLFVLWNLSSNTTFTINGKDVVIPGFMVWSALAYALIGTICAVRAGRALIGRNDEKYSREATYRKSLLRINEHSESIAFHRGEEFERFLVKTHLTNVTNTLKSLARAKGRLSYVAWGHGWLVTLISVAIASPGYLQHKFDFGGIMVVVGAFGQVQSSMRWFVANYANIADWRCLVNRLTHFDQLLNEHSGMISETQFEAEKKFVGVKNLKLSTGNGSTIVEGIDFQIASGDRILLGGESGCGKSSILRAIAGLWPWISGVVGAPPKSDSAFLPQKPYFPVGSLADALAYPLQSSEYSDVEFRTALERVNLKCLSNRLREEDAWDRCLSLGQQQRLSFARMLLSKPKWVFMDESTSALDELNETAMMNLFDQYLPRSTILSVGHRATLKAHHSRHLRIDKFLGVTELPAELLTQGIFLSHSAV